MNPLNALALALAALFVASLLYGFAAFVHLEILDAIQRARLRRVVRSTERTEEILQGVEECNEETLAAMEGAVEEMEDAVRRLNEGRRAIMAAEERWGVR